MRELKVLADGEPFALDGRSRLSGRTRTGLYPYPFVLQCRNLSEPEINRLGNTKELSVLHGGSCLAYGRVTDVFTETVPEGTVTTAVFSPGLDLWEKEISVSVPSGTSVSDTVRCLLLASGTGIRLLSFPGRDPFFPRGQAFCGRAAECITEVLSAAGAKGCLVPAGLCVIPAEPLPATLHLGEPDLTDRPAFADGGRKMILNTTVTGFRPGEEMTLSYEGKTYSGLILERMTEVDTGAGIWNTQLLIKRR